MCVTCSYIHVLYCVGQPAGPSQSLGDEDLRLLVAATVEENSSSTGLILRNTTLMPNIHGFPALMALLFAPRAEIRVNDTGTKYIGALCGLGYDVDTDMPLFPEHDMEVRFDVEINIQDLQEVSTPNSCVPAPLDHTENHFMYLQLGLNPDL
ncbi:unnamed protein product [Timema podura]|uniref:Uncharacterized protein n=1 Tax=Timema podura TaxID=61482 RepID=A0ABN7PJL0_TIMPD|nr:unnamed protein product [Timema podura]